MDWILWNPYHFAHAEFITGAILLAGVCGGAAILRFMPKQYHRRGLWGVFLLFWIFTIISATLLGRHRSEVSMARLELFRSVRCAYWSDIAGNILLFVPFGAAVPMVFPKARRWWIIFPIMLLCSAGIELIQYVSKLGILETDDIFNNTLGGMAGYIIAKITTGQK